MNEPTEIKYPLDENGEPYFAATHIDAVFGSEKLLEGLVTVNDWIEFTPVKGKPNTAFKAEGENGYNCSYRVIDLLGIKIKTVRLNLSNISNGMTIHTLPADFAKQSQSWIVRTPASRFPVTISLRPNGRLALSMNDKDKADWTETDYIYGSYTWLEKEDE